MKHSGVCLAMCLLFALQSFSSSAFNLQRIHPVDDDSYRAIEHLYIQQGLALPSSAGPWSAAELLQKLERLDYDRLNAGQRKAFDAVRNAVLPASPVDQERTAAVQFGLEAAAEGYYQSNTDDFFTEEIRWRYGYPDRSPVLNMPLEIWATDHFYGYFELSLMNSRHQDYFDQTFSTNLVFDDLLFAETEGDHNIALHFPVRGFAAAGGDHWSAQFGRDVLRWGDGISGNLIIGDHLDYHEFLRFTTFHDRIKFTTLASSFVHPAWFFDTAEDYLDPEGINTGRTADPREGFRALIGHRLEFRPADRWKVTFTETMMYMDESFEFRFLNPGMFYHNYYMRSNSKSLLGLELDFTPFQHYNFYANAVIDETGLLDNPRAWGALGGMKTSFPVGAGSAFFRLEGAYTDPFLYLRDGAEDIDDGDADEFLTFPIDHIVSLWQWGENFPGGESGLLEVRRFLGYRHGNDAAAVQAEAGYHEYNRWSLTAGALYLLEGTQDMYTVWDSDGHEDWAPTDSHPDDDRDAVQKTLLFELHGTLKPLDQLTLFAHSCYQHVWNIGNMQDGGDDYDIQVSVGASLAL